MGDDGDRQRSRSPARDEDRREDRDRSPPREEERRDDRSRSRSRGRDAGGSGKLKGTACRWNDRGFGFIKPSDGGEDLFCHVSCIEDGNMLREGDTVPRAPRKQD